MRSAMLSRYWLFQLAGWGSFLLLHTLFAYFLELLKEQKEVYNFFERLGIFILLGLFTTHIMRFVIIRLKALQKAVVKQIMQFLFITLFSSLISSCLYVMLLAKCGLLKTSEISLYQHNLFLLILSNAFYNFSFFFIWNLIYLIYHYVTKTRKQQLDTQAKELELKAIEAHINPIFISNTLESISASIDKNPEGARTAVTELSNILRSSLKALSWHIRK